MPILLSLPSAAFLWNHSDLPQFGDFHDDGLYYVGAKSLAAGSYRIESLPGQPFQTKYPPLYPLLLSIAWRVNPHFPENLPIAAWISWLAVPLSFAALMALYPSMGIEGGRKWLLLALLAVNPHILLFGSKLLSELWFTALLAAALWLGERAKTGTAAVAVAAGVAGGLAYLTRSAGIVLLPSAFLYLWLHGARRNAILFTVAMLPFIAGWMLWVRLHTYHSSDPALVYYTDYVGYEIYSVTPRTLPMFLWKNLDGLISGFGYLAFGRLRSSLGLKIVAYLLGAFTISGIVRTARSGRALYTIFAVNFCFLLWIWHFPPDERLLLPLIPLALAGLLAEMENFASALRGAWRRAEFAQKATAAAMMCLSALVLGVVAWIQVYAGTILLEESAQAARAGNIARRAGYAWIRANLPGDAIVVSYNDPAMYLYTGRHAIRRIWPIKIWYAGDQGGAAKYYRDLAPFARSHGAGYAYHVQGDDFGVNESDRAAIDQAVRTSPQLTPLYLQGGGTLYRVDAGGFSSNGTQTKRLMRNW